MYGDQFGEFVCGYILGLKGLKELLTVDIWMVTPTNFILRLTQELEFATLLL